MRPVSVTFEEVFQTKEVSKVLAKKCSKVVEVGWFTSAGPALNTSDSSSDDLSPTSKNWKVDKSTKVADVHAQAWEMIKVMNVSFPGSIEVVKACERINVKRT
ncbi:hypothetical protein AMTR_s00023p00086590 [Amborella trichopoda]|uniref:Uncharacterized protein n=1 Tax=Amborella trichopoda TaxID=13333 RepID=W1NK51_AMBTC|nr:hypothetical protein AMTR_s00023p00086590 [Amborella trichopoda]